jgi:hypothetical protein
MTAGTRLSARARESAACARDRLGRAGAGERERGRVAAGPLGWAEPEGEKEVGPSSILFFFFKIVNSAAICLFPYENFCVSFSRCKLPRKNVKS